MLLALLVCALAAVVSWAAVWSLPRYRMALSFLLPVTIVIALWFGAWAYAHRHVACTMRDCGPTMGIAMVVFVAVVVLSGLMGSIFGLIAAHALKRSR